MTVLVGTGTANPALYGGNAPQAFTLCGDVEPELPGSLPNDGKVIEDRRRDDRPGLPDKGDVICARSFWQWR